MFSIQFKLNFAASLCCLHGVECVDRSEHASSSWKSGSSFSVENLLSFFFGFVSSLLEMKGDLSSPNSENCNFSELIFFMEPSPLCL